MSWRFFIFLRDFGNNWIFKGYRFVFSLSENSLKNVSLLNIQCPKKLFLSLKLIFSISKNKNYTVLLKTFLWYNFWPENSIDFMSAYRPLENFIKLTVNESCILKTLRIMSLTIALVFQESQLERRQWLSHPVSYKHQTTPSVASKRDIPPTTITKGNIAWNEVDLAFDLGWFIKLPISM